VSRKILTVDHRQVGVVLAVPETVGEETRAGKVDDEEVDDELGDLERGQVFLPLFKSQQAR